MSRQAPSSRSTEVEQYIMLSLKRTNVGLDFPDPLRNMKLNIEDCDHVENNLSPIYQDDLHPQQ